MTTTHITDDIIESAIEDYDNRKSDDALTVEATRELLGRIQQGIEEEYYEWLDMLDDETVKIAHEDKEVIVFADHSRYGWNEELKLAGIEDDIHRSVVKSVHYKTASKITDYPWRRSDPFVFKKPEGWQKAEAHVRRTIAKLARESGSIARGVDRWAIERQDMTLERWGDDRIGTDRPHQTISKNAQRGREEAGEQN
ncbi:MAG: hypothetical protein ABEI52_02425 [Halobacteriaceae archaeon]